MDAREPLSAAARLLNASSARLDEIYGKLEIGSDFIIHQPQLEWLLLEGTTSFSLCGTLKGPDGLFGTLTLAITKPVSTSGQSMDTQSSTQGDKK